MPCARAGSRSPRTEPPFQGVDAGLRGRRLRVCSLAGLFQGARADVSAESRAGACSRRGSAMYRPVVSAERASVPASPRRAADVSAEPGTAHTPRQLLAIYRPVVSAERASVPASRRRAADVSAEPGTADMPRQLLAISRQYVPGKQVRATMRRMAIRRTRRPRHIGVRRASNQAERAGVEIAEARAEHGMTRTRASRRAGSPPPCRPAPGRCSAPYGRGGRSVETGCSGSAGLPHLARAGEIGDESTEFGTARAARRISATNPQNSAPPALHAGRRR
jgi:hypothetical protein